MTEIKCATFSIVARCESSGCIGVATASRVPAVGTFVINTKANIGACATQAFVNPYHKYWMMEYLAQGKSASEAMELSLARDPYPEIRQLAIVDRYGQSAAHTGIACDTQWAHKTGKNYAVVGNMLESKSVVKTMVEVFKATENENLFLEDRLLKCLKVGQEAGGDKRGKQSAALFVVDTQDYPLIDLRVDDHAEPIQELERLYDNFGERLRKVYKRLANKNNPGGELGKDFLYKHGILK
ncbi:DUF1028 domain-containing protein [Francisella sp. 19X1-34]|uniref:DUF1028 domain-containing protein n=1 Tax=Francisella sp. 19X1-34 TaxID=3087177 RepID=UPI002E32FDA9|nr:DUF1028 domain-containing protein [Francisella sp. 19X1-34]MED7788122.1 DUF1028 domain-containing protein [Francisella sp. 19X1-34]